MGDSRTILRGCLYFTASSLARQLTALADRCFRPTGLNPSQGFALMCVVDEPGITPSEIAGRLALAPSSVTRILETLQRLGYVSTRTEGRRVMTVPTAAGELQHPRVLQAWEDLHRSYAEVLGRKGGDDLCRRIHEASVALGARDGVDVA